MSEEVQAALLEVKARIQSAESNAKLFAALAKAQGEFKPITKSKTVTIKPREKPQYTFSYADMEELISCTRPALAANGLAVVQQLHDGKLVTQLLHADGGSISSEISVPRADGEPKSYGALLTYLRRYAYSALLCLAADDDLDEDGEDTGDQRGAVRTKESKEPKPRESKPSEKAQSSGTKMANGAQLKWVKDRLALLDPVDASARLANHGIKALDTELTAEVFEALKKELLA